ncbi:MAG TPA: hypothetical protein VGJ57_07670 [Nitrospirales bacterium]|jgi:hypothetical protein
MNPDDSGSRQERPNPWAAVTLITIAMVTWSGFQTYQLVRERGVLQSVKVAQEPTIEQARKLRTQLEVISQKTLELAQQGNAGASLIVEELARRGVRINPSPPPATATPEAPAAPGPSK